MKIYLFIFFQIILVVNSFSSSPTYPSFRDYDGIDERILLPRYRPANLDDFDVAKEVAVRSFSDLDVTTARYVNDPILRERYAVGNLSRIVSDEVTLVVEFPPEGSPPLVSEEGPQGLYNLWLVVGIRSLEVHQFTNVLAKDISPRTSILSQTAKVMVSARNIGIVNFLKDDDDGKRIFNGVCAFYITQVSWEVEVYRTIRGGLEPRITKIWERILQTVGQSGCPTSEQSIPLEYL